MGKSGLLHLNILISIFIILVSLQASFRERFFRSIVYFDTTSTAATDDGGGVNFFEFFLFLFVILKTKILEYEQARGMIHG